MSKFIQTYLWPEDDYDGPEQLFRFLKDQVANYREVFLPPSYEESYVMVALKDGTIYKICEKIKNMDIMMN